MKQLNSETWPACIHFTEVASPVDPRLVTLGELLDVKGHRIWACYGRTQVEIVTAAAAWLDDCHGRAGHTPPIMVDQSRPYQDLAAAIQRQVQA